MADSRFDSDNSYCFFVAVVDSVFCFTLVGRGFLAFASRLPLEPTACINPPLSATRASINAIKSGHLGSVPILVTANDSGHVVVHFTSIYIDPKKKTPQQPPILLEVHKSAWGIAISSSARLVAVSANSHTITVFDLRVHIVDSAASDRNNDENDSEDYNDDDTSWSLGVNCTKRVFSGHDNNIPNVEFSKCARFLASCSIDATCRIWDLKTGSTLAKISNTWSLREWNWSIDFISPSSFFSRKSSKTTTSNQPKPLLLSSLAVPVWARGIPECLKSGGKFPSATSRGRNEDLATSWLSASCRDSNDAEISDGNTIWSFGEDENEENGAADVAASTLGGDGNISSGIIGTSPSDGVGGNDDIMQSKNLSEETSDGTHDVFFDAADEYNSDNDGNGAVISDNTGNPEYASNETFEAEDATNVNEVEIMWIDEDEHSESGFESGQEVLHFYNFNELVENEYSGTDDDEVAGDIFPESSENGDYNFDNDANGDDDDDDNYGDEDDEIWNPAARLHVLDVRNTDSTNLLDNFTDFILHASLKHLYITDIRTGKTVCSLENVFSSMLFGHFQMFDRICIHEYVPELGLILAMTQAGAVAVITLEYVDHRYTGGTFGVPLEDLVAAYGVDSQIPGNTSVRLPKFVEVCFQHLYNMDLSVEGIFRKNGNIRRLKETADLFDKNPDLDHMEDDNVIQIAALLKKFLREMPEPLLTYKLHPLFVASQSAQNNLSPDTRKRIIHLLCCLLPKPNWDLLQTLLQFLQYVSNYKETNKMDVPNLATVMSPNILYGRGKNPGDDQPFLSITAVQMLIYYQDEFKMVPDDIRLGSDDAGGGGERVLWEIIAGILANIEYTNYFVFVYAREGLDKEHVLDRLKGQFNISFTQDQINRVSFVSLKLWKLLEAKRYKRLTLIGQSLGSMIVSIEALYRFQPRVFIDTIGFAFTFPVAKIWGCECVVAYVHYPTISTDMINIVSSGVETFNNAGVYKSGVGRVVKLLYYQLFACVYSVVGSFADVILANSSWTIGHLNEIWKLPNRTVVLYPPCDTNSLTGFSLENRKNVVLSVAQFRPEKAHKLQLESLQLFLSSNPKYKSGLQKLTLVFIGSVRNATDQALADSVRTQAIELGVSENVEVIENAPFHELKSRLGNASFGIHAMRNEHFGIGVVEYMAAGLITIANNSGGPKMDIIEADSTGFLASTKEEYAAALFKALSLSKQEQFNMRQLARESVSIRFSTNSFQRGFLKELSKII
ncbi:asparagine-linked glycosylation protein [Physocladia obscura]|uniref:GDP-Man:Man(3)GlcNAc(2)-PP-Dol alpha-1,2-mannosyltransferase n=1 Tax=Physocladia obscura TaxID=109957 RepID=A0AAD5XKN1_9FUNG|nr:asparagine-linked glycosylation protein [Physocladia obscura]